MRVGTPHYMAPEHIKGSPEKRSDLFSLGIILYQMLVGRLPFDGLLPETILMKNMIEWPLAPRTFRPERALAKQPDQRFQTAGDLLTAFKKAVATSSLLTATASNLLDQQEAVPSSRMHTSKPSRSHQGRQLRLDVAQLTNVGRKCTHNEDNLAYVIPKDEQTMARKGALFIVSDGIAGDNTAGEVASEIVIDAVTKTYYEDDNEDIRL